MLFITAAYLVPRAVQRCRLPGSRPEEVEWLCKSLGEPTSAPPVHPSRYRRQMQLEFAEPP